MPQEIERKYLVKGEYSPFIHQSDRITQGYICRETGRTVRVRIRNGKGYLTIKGASADKGLSRYEWEQEIPVDEAKQLMLLCQPGIIDKTRHLIHYKGHLIELDEFHGDNQGLTIAEIELAHVDEMPLLPPFIGEEVTGDPRYYNSHLTRHPYTCWNKQD